jgi:membrane associated rhomboid family serine protease
LIPLRDLNRSLTAPHVTRFLIVVNVIIFAVYWLSATGFLFDERLAVDMVGNGVRGKFVMYPDDVFDAQRVYTLLTSMFMHGGWYHLFGNMIYLWVFGDNVEDAFGHVSYLVFYLVCGVAASFAQIFADQLLAGGALVGMLGASGAISGVLGAYIVLYPRSKVVTWVAYFLIPIPAILFLGGWFVMQFLFGLLDTMGGVAYYAHIGGFIAGMFLGFAIGRERKRKIRDSRMRL